MPQFTYTGDQPRVYCEVLDQTTGATLFAEPGSSYDLLADPGDGLFEAAASAISTPAQPVESAPEAPVAPATPDTTPTTPTNN